jgi:NTP pyrophosphatase (non-canonical NTP hydrolase)|nr:MAG TPA: nucleoside triphosphate pyrophosphohydrolase [Caudoviricetes sp.]
MAYNIDESVIAKSIKYYGAEIQSTVCMEECAELIQAVSKAKRGKIDKDNMMEEIADVLICIEMLKQIYNIPDCSIKNWIERKQERMLRRMEK